jgi:nitrogen fixation NifU-like protein
VATDLYQEIILDHYKHPHGRGLREPYDAEVHHVNPTCGDEVTLRVTLAGDDIKDISYDGQGCSISQASASVLHELLTGRPVGEAMAVLGSFTELMGSRGQLEPDEDVLGDGIAFAGVSKYPARVKCALLAWMAFKDATAQAAAQDTAGRPGIAAGQPDEGSTP